MYKGRHKDVPFPAERKCSAADKAGWARMDVFNDGAALVTGPQLRRERSMRTTMLSLLIGTGGIMVTGIQPLLLGRLSARGVLSPGGLGLAGAVEIFGLAAGSIAGRRRRNSSGSGWDMVAGGVGWAWVNNRTGRVRVEWHGSSLC